MNIITNRSILTIMPHPVTWAPAGLSEASGRLSRSHRCSTFFLSEWRMRRAYLNPLNTTFPRLQKRSDMIILSISAGCFISISGFRRRSIGKWEDEFNNCIYTTLYQFQPHRTVNSVRCVFYAPSIEVRINKVSLTVHSSKRSEKGVSKCLSQFLINRGA